MKSDGRVSKVREARESGLSAEATWKAIAEGVEKSGMRPSGQAMTLGEWYQALRKVYGIRAARRCVPGLEAGK